LAVCAVIVNDMASFKKIVEGAEKLLLKHRCSAVVVGKSSIKTAGHGVFASREIVAGEAIALYPGIFTPPFPTTAVSDDGSINVLQRHDATNAYILNLASIGGFIDGRSLCAVGRLGGLQNPSVVGHLVNHPPEGIRPNADVASFLWKDVTSLQSIQDDYFPLPNSSRDDGSPWYFDSHLQEIVHFPTLSTPPTEDEALGGALLFATQSIHQGQEIFIDYALKPPYPEWARLWYKPAV
jgi:hypothetical protein